MRTSAVMRTQHALDRDAPEPSEIAIAHFPMAMRWERVLRSVAADFTDC